MNWTFGWRKKGERNYIAGSDTRDRETVLPKMAEALGLKRSATFRTARAGAVAESATELEPPTFGHNDVCCVVGFLSVDF